MSFSSVLLVAVELPEVLLPSSGFTSSSVRQSKSPSDSSCAKQWQHGRARRSAASQTRQHSPTSPVLARCQLTRKAIFRGSTSGGEVMVQGRILLHFSGEATQVKQTLHTYVMCSISTLTLESSSCVLSSSSPFLVLLIVVWLSSSLFTERGSRSDEVVPVASFRSGGEELRDVWRRNSSMANLWNQQLKKKSSGHWPHVVVWLPTCTQYLFQVVDLLDVATLGRLQLADVPVLISALLEKCRGANLVAAREYETFSF